MSPHRSPTAAGLAAVADQLETSSPKPHARARALLRLLIEDCAFTGLAEILPTYRLITPTVYAMSEKVEATGIGPAEDSRRRVNWCGRA
jgi:hypothetical protein